MRPLYRRVWPAFRRSVVNLGLPGYRIPALAGMTVVCLGCPFVLRQAQDERGLPGCPAPGGGLWAHGRRPPESKG